MIHPALAEDMVPAFDLAKLNIPGRVVEINDFSAPASQVFLVANFSTLAGNGFKNLFVRSIGRLSIEYDLEVGLALRANSSSRAFVCRAGSNLSKSITGVSTKAVLVITPKTSLIDLKHEEQHLRDFRDGIPQKIVNHLNRASFDPAKDQPLLDFLLELRSYIVEADQYSEVNQFEVLKNFRRAYALPVLSILNHRSREQRLALNQMIRLFTADLSSNLISRWVDKKFRISCEFELREDRPE